MYFSSIERNVENKEKEEKETLNQISYSIFVLDLCYSNNAERYRKEMFKGWENTKLWHVLVISWKEDIKKLFLDFFSQEIEE